MSWQSSILNSLKYHSYIICAQCPTFIGVNLDFVFSEISGLFLCVFVEHCDTLGRKEIEKRDGVWMSPSIKPYNTPWVSSVVSCHNAVLEKSPEREFQMCGEVGQGTASTNKCGKSYRNKCSLFPKKRFNLKCFSQRNVKLKS